jgi:P-type Ca2+ transporter type 2C
MNICISILFYILKNLNIIKFHSLSLEESARELNTDLKKGLSKEEIVERIKTFGSNNITENKEQGWFIILLRQFNSPIVYLLLFAAGLSFWFKEWVDGIAILAVLIINSLVGFYMEFRAKNSMKALKRLTKVPAKVIRDSEIYEINSDEIVPGDIVYVEAGDLVPADGRISACSQLQSDESPLTGESLPVEKNTKAVPEETELAERTSMLFKGTYISKGNAYFLVTGTGMVTELGKVATLVENSDQAVTPLEKKLEQFSKRLIKITVVLVLIIFSAGMLYGQDIVSMIGTSVALAVAAIPEGLPIVATMALAQGMLKMARHKVIVKKLSAVETLGGTNIICTDKTGTLTKNQIEVSKIIPAAEQAEELIIEVCVGCNTANVSETDGKEFGDPLEIGLLQFAASRGADVATFRKERPKIKEDPFSSETKIMSTMHEHEHEQEFKVYSKGAAEELLKICSKILYTDKETTLDETEKENWLGKAEELAATGTRVIAAAYKKASSKEENLSHDLVFLGLIGMVDPPREEVFSAIEECRSAGIGIIMITGDHPATAQSIARELKISDNENEKAITGKEMTEFVRLSPEEKEKWSNTHVFARVSPKQKLDIISVLQERKNVVAMTGDGINDAPALKKADIGVAMGLRGTQVAQEVADMILKDDSFTSIVLAIKQGRAIFENIRKFVVFLLSCNLSELLVISVAAIFNLHFQLFPVQILFINLITDVLPALALGMTEGRADIMKDAPRNITEEIIDSMRWKAIFIYSSVIGAMSVVAVITSQYVLHAGENISTELGNNILFYTLIFSQLLHVFNMNGSGSFFRSEITRNKYVWISVAASIAIVLLFTFIDPLKNVLSISPMSASDWTIIIASSLFSMVVIALLKKLKLAQQ